jgi:hypothetical protein
LTRNLIKERIHRYAIGRHSVQQSPVQTTIQRNQFSTQIAELVIIQHFARLTLFNSVLD